MDFRIVCVGWGGVVERWDIMAKLHTPNTKSIMHMYIIIVCTHNYENVINMHGIAVLNTFESKTF